MQTRAAVLNAVNTPIEIETLELAPPRVGEVLVKVAAAGVCHSDWHVVSGATTHPLPVVLGHEGAGIVVETGPGVEHLRVGDHVALNWAPSCGQCFYCLRGSPSLCEAYLEPIWGGVMMDGTPRFSRNGQPVFHFSALGCFSEWVVVPAVCCVPLPPEVPLAIAALIGCAVTTGVGAVLNTAKTAPGSSVVVFGAGGVGLSAVLGARLAGASPIIVIDRAPAEAYGGSGLRSTHFLVAGPDTIDRIRTLTGGRGADYVFEAVGSTAVQELCLAAATRRNDCLCRVGADGEQHQPAWRHSDAPGEDGEGQLLWQFQPCPRLPFTCRSLSTRPTGFESALYEFVSARTD
ncbi:MAG: alcohol dehydrogenase catalytic domain-containing protein [Anaerolineales bacterium]|nr:alcohol dehydrogenase catalytic domain-containing protein [Anaerolineales bacterium]